VRTEELAGIRVRSAILKFIKSGDTKFFMAEEKLTVADIKYYLCTPLSLKTPLQYFFIDCNGISWF